MQTRQKSYTQQTPPRTAEVQQPIDDDAKLAKKICMLAPSPIKTGGREKPGSKQLRTSTTPKRLAFGGVGSNGQVKKRASITPKRLAIKIEENAQVQVSGASEDAAADHWRVQDGDESDLAAVEHSHDEAQEGEHDHNMEESSLAEETRMAHKKLRSLFKERRKIKRINWPLWLRSSSKDRTNRRIKMSRIQLNSSTSRN